MPTSRMTNAVKVDIAIFVISRLFHSGFSGGWPVPGLLAMLCLRLAISAMATMLCRQRTTGQGYGVRLSMIEATSHTGQPEATGEQRQYEVRQVVSDLPLVE